MFFAEESLILLTLDPGEIPRFARNDNKKNYFRSLFSVSHFSQAGTIKPDSLKSVLLHHRSASGPGFGTRSGLKRHGNQNGGIPKNAAASNASYPESIVRTTR